MPLVYPIVYDIFSGVAASTTLLTRDGPQVISTLEGQTAVVWNGAVWEEMTIVKIAEDKPLYLVSLADGRTLQCSDWYDWYQLDSTRAGRFFATKTKDLPAQTPVWWTLLETDFAGSPPASLPVAVSASLQSTSADLYAVSGSSSGLAVFNGVLASVGIIPEGSDTSADISS